MDLFIFNYIQLCFLFLFAVFLLLCPGGEMADTTALEAVAARHGGSSPLLGTKTEKYTPQGYFLCFVFDDLKAT